MARGSIETLRMGFRARVYAGKDPITGRQNYLRGETRRLRRDAEADAERLLAHVEADQRPDRHATVGLLLDRWIEVVDHELSTASIVVMPLVLSIACSSARRKKNRRAQSANLRRRIAMDTLWHPGRLRP